MSGLVKAKKYDWKDTNLALFGSDTEKEVKLESAQSEPAWEGAGTELGLQIWRIVKFEVQHWDKADYGKFYNGDSYIILNTYKENEDSEALSYDLHFWIGKNSSQDEYGTAAYKTVELDTFLNDEAVQHREVWGHESKLFKSYFSAITLMDGGAESGFNKVEPEEYQPRLLHFKRVDKHVTVKQVPLCRDRLTSDDVFILDNGLELFQWNGSGCNKDEKFRAMQYMSELKSERSGRPETDTLEEEEISDSHKFYGYLTEENEEDEDELDDGTTADLYKVSDESGEINFEKVKEGDITRDDFSSDDVFIFDTGKECFVFVGANASPAEKKNSLSYAHSVLVKTIHPLSPITVIKEGRNNIAFNEALGMAA